MVPSAPDRRKSGHGAMKGWKTRRANMRAKQDEVKRLWLSLLHYGRHTDDCRYRTGHDCDCGWEGLKEIAKPYK
jgi:hypothetical protein